MIRLTLAGAAVATIAVLAGCATMTKAECEAGDWRSVGMADGSNGRPLAYLDQHNAACADHGIPVNRQLYEAGRNDGLRVYCRLDRAEREGREGRTYYNVCTGDVGVGFNRVYLDAKAIHDIDRQVTSMRRELDALLDEMVIPGLSGDRLTRLRAEIRIAQNALNRLERDRSAAERQLALTRRQEEERLAQG